MTPSIELSKYTRRWSTESDSKNAALLKLSVDGRLFEVFVTESTANARIETERDARELYQHDLTKRDLERVAREVYDRMDGTVHDADFSGLIESPAEPSD